MKFDSDETKSKIVFIISAAVSGLFSSIIFQYITKYYKIKIYEDEFIAYIGILDRGWDRE